MSSLTQRITDLSTRIGQEIKAVYTALGGKAAYDHNHSGTYEPADSTIVKTASTQTLTNKRITDRVGSTTSSATPTINTDNYDAYSITALAEAITSMTTNLSGTPTNFQMLLIRIKDNGTARAITWGTSFQSGVATLPTTTVAGKTLLVGLMWDSVDSKWTCESVGSRA
jgi:hypothetical protein